MFAFLSVLENLNFLTAIFRLPRKLPLHWMEGRKFHLPVRLKAEEVEEHLRNRRCVIVAFFGKSPLAHRCFRHFSSSFYYILLPGLGKGLCSTRFWAGRFSTLKRKKKTYLLLRATLTLTEMLCSSI